MTTDALSSTATRLGLLATVPFIAGAVGVWIPGHTEMHRVIAQALSAYAAVVISFIGAIHWGFAFPQRAPRASSFVWGIVPSLVAWVALLLPAPVGLVVDAIALLACWGVDRTTYPAAGAAAWLPLRLGLTVIATLCCLIGAAGA